MTQLRVRLSASLTAAACLRPSRKPHSGPLTERGGSYDPIQELEGTRRAARVLRTAVASAMLLAMIVSLIPARKRALRGRPASEVTAFSGLVNPTEVRFAPGGKVFVAEKRGTIQMYDGLSDSTPRRSPTCALRSTTSGTAGCSAWQWDSGFTAGRPYLYALYTFDGDVGGTAPRACLPTVDGP